MKTEIENWFAGAQNYQKGIDLLIKTGKVRGSKLKCLQRGESRSNKEKLAWELCEAVKLPRSITKSVNTNVTDTRVSAMAVKNGGSKTTIEPPIITKIKEKIAGLSNLRGQIHDEMSSLGLENNDDTVARRAELLLKITEITNEFNRLFEIKESFFKTKIVPADSVLNAVEKEAEAAGSKSIVELMKSKNNLRSQLTKAKNKIAAAKNKADKAAATEKYDRIALDLQHVEDQITKLS